MYRRTLMTLAAALMGTTLLGAGAATAQEYPDRPIQMIVPWGAGGGTDAVGRIFASLLQEAQWRVLLLCAASLLALVTLSAMLVSDSPRQLVVSEHPEKALAVLGRNLGELCCEAWDHLDPLLSGPLVALGSKPALRGSVCVFRIEWQPVRCSQEEAQLVVGDFRLA